MKKQNKKKLDEMIKKKNKKLVKEDLIKKQRKWNDINIDIVKPKSKKEQELVEDDKGDYTNSKEITQIDEEYPKALDLKNKILFLKEDNVKVKEIKFLEEYKNETP